MIIMKRTIIIFLTIFVSAGSFARTNRPPFENMMPAQDSIPAGYELVDSVVYRQAPAQDSSLTGKIIFNELPLVSKGDATDVKVHQSKEIWDAMYTHFTDNRSKTMSGYRVRIFFDNKRTAREESEKTLARFSATHRDIAAYRSYANPYFKVTVGDFRTKSEAMQLLKLIKNEFPSAFIVKENISYPIVNKEKPIITDTIKVLRPMETDEVADI